MADPGQDEESIPPNEESSARGSTSKQESAPGGDAIPSSPPIIPFSDAPSPTSSEPPIFSSDGPGHMDDVENYASPRNKRKRRGPWWDPDTEYSYFSMVKRGRSMARYDSGVVAYSDEIYPVELVPEEMKALDRDHLHFVQHLLDGVSVNDDYYAYNTGTLRDSHLEHVNLLDQIISLGPDPGTEVPADGQYRSMVPELKLNFSNNLLCHLHINLFSLENLTHLNLRNNKIRELPPQIGRFRNLRSLNLSNNDLFWMPFELHSLLRPQGNLEMFSFSGNCMPWTDRPNPLTQPYGMSMFELHGRYKLVILPGAIRQVWGRLSNATSSETGRAVPRELTDNDTPLDRSYENPLLSLSAFEYLEPYLSRVIDPARHVVLGCTPVSYYTERGQLTPGSFNLSKFYDFEKAENELDSVCVIPTSRGIRSFPRVLREGASPAPAPSVPSLFSLGMSQAVRSESPATIRELFAHTPIPQLAEEILSRAEENETNLLTALLTCRCGKSFVVPRAVWFEFWMHGWEERLPYKVQVCSWACAKRFYMQNYLDPEEDPVLARRGWITRLDERLRREVEEEEAAEQG